MKRGDYPAAALAAAVRDRAESVDADNAVPPCAGDVNAGAGGSAWGVHRVLLSALKSYPFLNNPILPVLFLFSGISSGAAVALIAMALRHRSNPHSTEAHFVHRMEVPVVWLEIFLLAAFFVGPALGDDGKMRALAAALGGGFWTRWFWLGVAGLGLILPMLLKPRANRSSTFHGVLAVCGASLTGVLLLRFFHSLCGSANRCVR
nr:Formate-dependent nitrite reductase, membrane component [Citrobacter werkmanii]